MSISYAYARDPDGRYAQSSLKSWFDQLHAGKGPCCADADGNVLIDADWKSNNGHYQVRIPFRPGGEPEWIVVPDDAVITEPNKDGRTIVWPLYGYLGVDIRCFMPGPGS